MGNNLSFGTGGSINGLDQGFWDANANVPDLTVIDPTKSVNEGKFWHVSVAGGTDLGTVTAPWAVNQRALIQDGKWVQVAAVGDGLTMNEVNAAIDSRFPASPTEGQVAKFGSGKNLKDSSVADGGTTTNFAKDAQLNRDSFRLGGAGIISAFGAGITVRSLVTGQTFTTPIEYYTPENGSQGVSEIGIQAQESVELQSDDSQSMSATGSVELDFSVIPNEPDNKAVWEIGLKGAPAAVLSNFRFRATVEGQSEPFFYFPTRADVQAGQGKDVTADANGIFLFDIEAAPMFLLNKPTITVEYFADSGSILGSGTAPFVQERRSAVELNRMADRDWVQEDAQIPASNVQNSATNQTGLLAGAATQQIVNDRIDAQGIGAPIFQFDGSYAAGNANINQWYNGLSFRHLQSNPNQGNGLRTFDLPGMTALNTVFDAILSNQASETEESFELLISNPAGTSSSISVNRLQIRPRSGGPAIAGRSVITLSLGEAARLEVSRSGGTVTTNPDGTKTRADGTITSYTLLSEAPIQTTSGPALNDIELQPIGWNAAANSFLPSSVLKGYAYKVFGAPADGSGRLGEIMYNDDWVVWEGDTFSPTGPNWATEPHQWFVISAHDVRRLTAKDQNFLAEITETDTPRPVRIYGINPGVEALAWVVDKENPLSSAPFLSPNTGQNPDPRNNPNVIYTGGRDELDANNDSNINLSRFPNSPIYSEYEIIIGIESTFIDGHDEEDIYIEHLDTDFETVLHRYQLSSSFRKPDFSDGQLDYFLLDTTQAGDSATLLRVHDRQKFRIVFEETDRSFSLSEDIKVSSNNVPDGGWAESDLSQTVRGKLNRETSLSPADRTRLDAIITEEEGGALPDTFDFRLKYGGISANPSDYVQLDSGNGIIGQFSSTPIVMIVPDTITITNLTWPRGTIPVTEVSPSIFDNTKTYMATIPAFSGSITETPLDYVISFAGSITTTLPTGLVDSVKIRRANLTPELANEIFHQQQPLPESLQALAANAEVFHFNNTSFVMKNEHAGIRNSWAIFKNEPQGKSIPPVAGDIVNEITNSDVTVTVGDLGSVYVDQPSSNPSDRGVDIFTDGHMTGPGIVQGDAIIELPSENNYRQVLGFWLYAPNDSPSNKRLIEIRDSANIFRPVFSLRSGRLAYHKNNQDGGPATTRTVDHTLYGVDGVLTHTFAGTPAQEELWRVYEARQYTINARLIANGNDEGSTTLNYTVADLNTSQGRTTQTLTFGNGHTQEIGIEYVANSSLYGGSGHTLRVDIQQLADNENFDIDHILMSVTYQTTETVPASDDTYSIVEIPGTNLGSGVLHKCIFELRKNPTTDRLEALFSIDGNSFDTIDDFDYDVFRFKWDGFMLNDNDLTVMQNIQGLVLNTDTPLIEFPTHAMLRDWVNNHDDKQDYVWDNVKAPARDIEAVRFPENVVFPNQIFVSPDNTRWRLSVGDDGALMTVKEQ